MAQKRPSQLNQLTTADLDKANDVVVTEDVSVPDVGYSTLADILALAAAVDVGLGNVPNEDATDPANWDPANTDGNFLVGDGTTFVAESGQTARNSIGLGNVPNEDATNPANWDQDGASDGDQLQWDGGNNRWVTFTPSSGGDNWSALPARDIGQTSSNVTLDLSKNAVFELEPTANITIDITGLAASGSRARGIINGIDLGSHTLTWTVNGSGTDALFSGGSLSLLSSTTYDISVASFNQSLNVGSEDANPQGMEWNDDGTKMYLVGAGSDKIYEYTLSSAYDIGTASFSQSFSVSGEDANANGMAWNNDGTKMYMTGDSTDKIYEYTLSTAYDVSTASLNQSIDVSGQDSVPRDVAWNNDGTKMYMVGSGLGKIYQYTVSTAYDIGTASHNDTLDTGTEDDNPQGMAWNNDGTKLYMIGKASDKIWEYTLSTAYDVGTASVNQSFDVSGQDTIPTGMAWNSNGSKMYMVGGSNDNIYEYTGFDIAKQELRLEQFGTGQVLISD